jgi:hypothetical protein
MYFVDVCFVLPAVQLLAETVRVAMLNAENLAAFACASWICASCSAQ